MGDEKNHEKFLVITHQEHNSKAKVLFLGDPYEIIQSIRVSSFIPRYSFVPFDFAQSFIIFCEYLFQFSLALAFFNSLPSIFLDGNLISNTLIDIYLPNDPTKNLIARAVLVTIGSFLILIFLIV